MDDIKDAPHQKWKAVMERPTDAELRIDGRNDRRQNKRIRDNVLRSRKTYRIAAFCSPFRRMRNSVRRWRTPLPPPIARRQAAAFPGTNVPGSPTFSISLRTLRSLRLKILMYGKSKATNGSDVSALEKTFGRQQAGSLFREVFSR